MLNINSCQHLKTRIGETFLRLTASKVKFSVVFKAFRLPWRYLPVWPLPLRQVTLRRE